LAESFHQPDEAAVAYPLLLAKLLVRTGLARFLPGVRRRLQGGAEVLRYCSDRLLTAPLDELERAGKALEPRADDVLDLAQGAPRFDLLPSASSKLPGDRRGWPPAGGLPELCAAVAAKLLADNGLAFRPQEEVLIAAGALGAVHTVLDAFVNRGDRVVLPDPVSPLYPLAVRARGARTHYLTTWMEDGRTRFRLDHLSRALRWARLIVLTSPGNPNGGVIAPEDLEQIAWWADRHDVLILSDEVFERYHYDSAPVSVGTLDRARRRTLTVGSVSKGHALAWARVGWLAAPRDLLRACAATAALRTPFVPTLCQQIACAALRTGPDLFEPVRTELRSRRHYTHERLRGLELNAVWPAGAFFVWVPVWQLGLSGREFAARLLRDKRVLVTPGDLFGPSGAGHVRISYATDDGRLREGLNRLGEFVQGLQGARPGQSKRAA
jgi:aspartate/methionine/tyrosine aminotransferase